MNLLRNFFSLFFTKRFLTIKGYKFADKQIRDANSSFSLESYSIRDGDPSWIKRQRSIWKNLSYDMAFTSGYTQRWAEFGREDARKGICDAHKYETHGYNVGWRGEIKILKSKGWENSRLENDFKLMEKFYFNNIRSGTSDEYYQQK